MEKNKEIQRTWGEIEEKPWEMRNITFSGEVNKVMRSDNIQAQVLSPASPNFLFPLYN